MMKENNRESAQVTCPFCGSDKVRKAGSVKGVRRFFCLNKDCSHKSFSERYANKACDPREPSPATCPHCGSDKVRFNSTTKYGVRRYLCLNKDCSHKTFVERYTQKGCDPVTIRENEQVSAGVTCPYCGSANVKVERINKIGVRRFRCLNEDCSHKTFNEQYKARGNVTCPHCGSERVCKHGRAKDGRQYYLCLNKDCPHKSFVETYKNKARDPSYVRENEFAGVTCPHCGSANVKVRNTDKNGARRFRCLNENCSHKTFNERYKTRGKATCPHKSFVEERPDKASPQSRRDRRRVASPAMTGLPVPQQTGDPPALTERLALRELIMDN